MNIRLLIVLVLVLICLSGCNKGSNSSPMPNSTVYLPIQVTHTSSTGAVDVTTLQYDSQNRLIEYTSDLTKNDLKFTYDANNRIISEDATLSGISTGNGTTTSATTKVVYDYSTPGTIIANQTNASNNASLGANTFTLNSAQQVTKITYGSTSYILRTYDGNGNVVTESQYYPNTPTQNNTYTETHDQNKSPYSGIAGNSCLIMGLHNVNNVIGEVLVYNAINGNPTYTFQTTYNLNGDGYAIKAITMVTSPNNVVTTDTYVYTYITK